MSNRNISQNRIVKGSLKVGLGNPPSHPLQEEEKVAPAVKTVYVCPLLSRNGSEPSECLGKLCAWYVNGECAVVRIAATLLLSRSVV
jgi:hypothetical protein